MESRMQTVGEIKKEDYLFSKEDSSILRVATDLIESHYPGMPVINEKTEVIGYISEQDILHAFREFPSVDKVKVKDIMTKSPLVVEERTTLEQASKIMEEKHIHRLPVVRNKKLVGTVTRHDLLRAWVGLSPVS